ncbi:hypothetical protein V8E53_000398 [Lactarius tabidus]
MAFPLLQGRHANRWRRLYSRQLASLPLARLYSTPSKRSSASVLDTRAYRLIQVLFRRLANVHRRRHEPYPRPASLWKGILDNQLCAVTVASERPGTHGSTITLRSFLWMWHQLLQSFLKEDIALLVNLKEEDATIWAMGLDQASRCKKRNGTPTRLRKEQMVPSCERYPSHQASRSFNRTATSSEDIPDPQRARRRNSQKQGLDFLVYRGLDATHVLLATLALVRVVNSRLDVYLGSDSYWSHASSIDQMSTLIRETLIALHPSDVYGKLLNEARG